MKSVRAVRERSRVVPSDWMPSQETIQWGQGLGFSIDQLNFELVLMRGHEFQKPRKLWDQTFRNWLLLEEKTRAKRESRAPRLAPGKAQVIEGRSPRHVPMSGEERAHLEQSYARRAPVAKGASPRTRSFLEAFGKKWGGSDAPEGTA